ncbi:acyl-CoA N-acyltransferase [Gymnopus androsaceus JB14]|uniref:Acyl-CoA N-acyltransferase n=1 Tax=Gymnopus androsaceus JB14 TaxID=1447944 RepID=A0A6A4HAK5_9AGAR|nr:acyl-CoA N-acyltransferase [Gymnopus androsaceus JB14]
MASHITVAPCAPSAYRSIIPQLAMLLKSCVDDNITMNFVQPFSIEDASKFWLSMEENIIKGKQFVIIAQEDSTDSDGVPIVLGCVILNLSQTPNAGHRGEVGKMIVGKEHRKRGIGKILMDCMEEVSRKNNRTVLVLDTQTGSGAEIFYERMGYNKVGVLPDVTLSPDRKQYTSCTFFIKKL